MTRCLRQVRVKRAREHWDWTIPPAPASRPGRRACEGRRNSATPRVSRPEHETDFGGLPMTDTNAATTKNAPSLGILVVKTATILLLVQVFTLFVAAGTLGYWQAWLYLGVHLAVTTLTNVYLVRRAPELLRRRFAGEAKGEAEGVHKLFQAGL